MFYKGKNREEAILNAEKDLGRSINEFSYKISERKIGIFKKEVEIEIQEKIDNSKQPSQGEIKNEEFVFHSGEGKVTLVPTEQVILSVNGVIYKDSIEVSNEDQVKIKGAIKEEQTLFDINIDSDELIVTLKVTSIPEVIYNVNDHGLSQKIVLYGDILSTKEAAKISIDDIKDELVKKGIKYGINFGEISKAIETGQGIIARGKAPVESIDDRIGYYFDVDVNSRKEEVTGKVNYYEIKEIECVEKGSILAEIIEGKDGEPGVNVYGKIIPSKARKVARFKLGQGVEISEDEKKVFALIDGKPSLEDEKISVVSVFQINGDADMSIGSLEFEGDIFVSGSIKEGTKISSGGNVTVLGSVLESSIHSKGAIDIKGNLIASTIKSGNIKLNELDYIEKLNEVKEFLGAIIDIGEEINIISFDKIKLVKQSQILKKIIDSKYTNKKQFFKNLKSEYLSLKMNDEFKNLLSRFFAIYESIMEEHNVELNQLKMLKFDLEKFLDLYETVEASSDIHIGYSQNSKIYSSKDVFIEGKGCYNTNIEAEGIVKIEGYPGTFRSGMVYGKKGIHINEIGSSAGIKNIIKTNKEGQISAKVIYHNTLLLIGNFNYYIDEPIKNVKVYIKDGDFVIEKLNL